MSDLDLSALRAKAKAATPGEWVRGKSCARTVFSFRARNCCTIGDFKYLDDAAFIAAAEPAVVLSLIDRVERAEALIAKAGKPSPVYKAVEQILDEHSAWISSPNHKVTSAVALAAVIAADLESGASSTLGALHVRCDEADAEIARLRALLARAGEALKPLIRNATAQFDHSVPLDFPRDLNRNIKNGRTVAREIEGALK